MKTQDITWVDALRTGKEPLITDLADLFLCLSALGFRLDKLGADKDKYDLDHDTNRANCLTLLTQFLLQNGIESLEELEATSLEFVSGILKVPFLGFYLPLSIVGALISVKTNLSIARVYPGLTLVVGMIRVTLEGYLSSWTSVN